MWVYQQVSKLLLLCLTGLLNCLLPLHAQTGVAAQQLEEGIELYRNQQFERAYAMLESALYVQSGGQQVQQAAFWKARAAIAMRHSDAEQEVQAFLSRYTDQAMQEKLLIELGNYFFEEENYRKAMRYFARTHPSFQPNNEEAAKVSFRYAYALKKAGRERYFDPKEPAHYNPLRYFDGLKVTDYPYALDARYYAGNIRIDNPNEAVTGAADLERYLLDRGVASARLPTYRAALERLLKYYTDAGQPKNVEKWLAKFDGKAPNQQPDVYLVYRAKEAYDQDKMELFTYYIQLFSERQTTETQAENDSTLNALIAYAHAQQGEYLEAIRYWNQLLPEDKKTTQQEMLLLHYYNLGLAYLKIGQPHSALDVFEQLTEASNLNGKLSRMKHNSLRISVLIAIEIKDPDKTKTLTEKYLTEHGDSKHASKMLAACIGGLCKMGEQQQALSMLTKYSVDYASDPLLISYFQFLYLENGKALYQKEKYHAAITSFDKGLGYVQNQDYTNETNFWSGMAYLQLGNTEMGLARLRDVPKRSSVGQQAVYHMGYTYYNQHDYYNAQAYFQEYAYNGSSTQHREDAFLRMADCQAATEQYTAAFRSYNELFEKMPQERDYITFQLGYLYLVNNNLNQAIRMFDRLIEQYPKSPYRERALFYAGTIEGDRKSPERAVRRYEQLLADYPEGSYAPAALYKKGSMFWNQGIKNGAIRDFSKLVSEYTTHPFALDAMKHLEIYVSGGGFIEDIVSFREAIDSAHPGNTVQLEQSLADVKNMIFLHNNNQAAISTLAPLVRKYSGSKHHNEIFFLLGVAYQGKGTTNLAHQAYNRVHPKIDIDYCRKAWQKQAKLYRTENNLEAEVRTIEKLLPHLTNKNQIGTYLKRLCELYVELEQLDKAEQTLEKLQEQGLGGDGFYAFQSGKIAHAKEKKNSEALAFFNKAIQVSQDPVIRERALFEAGTLLYQEKRYEEAITYLQQIHGRAPELEAVFLNGKRLLFEALRSLDYKELAESLAKELTARYQDDARKLSLLEEWGISQKLFE